MQPELYLTDIFGDGSDTRILGELVNNSRIFAQKYNQFADSQAQPLFEERDHLPESEIHVFGTHQKPFVVHGKIVYFEQNWRPFRPETDIQVGCIPGKDASANEIVQYSKTGSEMFFISKGPLTGVIINRIPGNMAIAWQAIASGEVRFNLPDYDSFLPVAQILTKGDKPRIQHLPRLDKADVMSCYSGHSNRYYYGLLTGTDAPIYGDRDEAIDVIRKAKNEPGYDGYNSTRPFAQVIAIVDEIEEIINRQSSALEQAGIEHHDLDYNWCVSYCEEAVLTHHLQNGGNINNLPVDAVTFNPLVKLSAPTRYRTIVRLIDLDCLNHNIHSLNERWLGQRMKNVTSQVELISKIWTHKRLTEDKNIRNSPSYRWFREALAGVSIKITGYNWNPDEVVQTATLRLAESMRQNRDVFRDFPLDQARYDVFLNRIRICGRTTTDSRMTEWRKGEELEKAVALLEQAFEIGR